MWAERVRQALSTLRVQSPKSMTWDPEKNERCKKKEGRKRVKKRGKLERNCTHETKKRDLAKSSNFRSLRSDCEVRRKGRIEEKGESYVEQTMFITHKEDSKTNGDGLNERKSQ